ncbi:MAG: M3 family oligoendopeptidase [Candidatus Nanoarchaeia archaeon]|nr:M3 family oligoendopeptidase [Candidatus Nanoarchaeia archaeon]
MYGQSGWDLSDLFDYPESPKVEDTIKQIKCLVEDYSSLRDKLDNLAQEDFVNQLRLNEKLTKAFSKLSIYSQLLFRQDTSSEKAKSFMLKMRQFGSEINNKTLFFNLWWAGLDNETAEHYLSSQGLNDDMKHVLYDSRRVKQYNLTEPEEKIINMKAATGADALESLYTIITSKYRFNIAVDGKKEKLTGAELLKYFFHPKHEIRKKAYNMHLKRYAKDADVIGEIYKNMVIDLRNESHLKGYPSPMSVRTINEDLPDEVVNSLLDSCSENISIFQKFFELKKELCGLDKFTRYDLYAPMEKINKEIEYNEGVNYILKTLDEFSPDIGNLGRKLFDSNHIDSESGTARNKVSGYCWAVSPDTIPFISVSYDKSFNELSILAHEIGHGIHGLLASNHDIFTFDAASPLAETASIFNELLLLDRTLSEENNPNVKREILAKSIDNAYGTITRQAYFVRFEKEAHELIKNGAELEDINKAYLSNVREQFGHDVPEIFKNEWLRIPHFFFTIPFYCYSYSFGQLLSMSLFNQYKKEGEDFIQPYKNILSAGGSKPPIQILSDEGIDISSEKFWQRGFDMIKDMTISLENMI